MTERCLIIADDLTGGADAGAQFIERGLSTFLISYEENLSIDFSKYALQDVLVINTDSRGLSPEKASYLISRLFKGHDPDPFAVIYKKIDSTLRGNVGYEIDALMRETGNPFCFMTPSYPEQNRTVVDGILMISGEPLASTEISRDASFPVRESHVCKLLTLQSRNPIGWIGLKDVASGKERLKRRVEEEKKRGNRIIVFDAASRRDLMNIAEVAFRMERIPLFVGSAGLAKEVARKLSSSEPKPLQHAPERTKLFKHLLIVSGSASSVTHEQLRRVETQKIPPFVLSPEWVIHDDPASEIEKKRFFSKDCPCSVRRVRPY